MNRPTKNQLGLIALGGTALIAGCSGGGIVQHASGATSYVPPATPSQGPNAAQNGKTATALLTITIPARGAQRIARRPQYISQGTAAVGVTVVSSPNPGPSATEQAFAMPSPGPSATTTTLPVTAPVGTDTITVKIYDALPASTSSPNVLGLGSTTATVATGATNPINVSVLGVAAGVQLTVGNATPRPSVTPSPYYPMANVNASQLAQVHAVPVDAAGYAIAGNLATAVPLVAPTGVTFSPVAVASAGSLTMTYPAGSSASGTLTANLALDRATGSTDNVAITPETPYFAYSGSQVAIVSPQRNQVLSTVDLGTSIAALTATSGCTSGYFALADVGNGAPAQIVLVTASSAGAPNISVKAANYTTGSASTLYAADGTCHVYSYNANGVPGVGSNYAATTYGGTDATVAVATPAPGATQIPADTVQSIAASNGTLYISTVGLHNVDNVTQLAAGVAVPQQFPTPGPNESPNGLNRPTAIAGTRAYTAIDTRRCNGYKDWVYGWTENASTDPFAAEESGHGSGIGNNSSYTVGLGGSPSGVLAGGIVGSRQFYVSTTSPTAATYTTIANAAGTNVDAGTNQTFSFSPDGSILCVQMSTGIAFYSGTTQQFVSYLNGTALGFGANTVSGGAFAAF